MKRQIPMNIISTCGMVGAVALSLSLPAFGAATTPPHRVYTPLTLNVVQTPEHAATAKHSIALKHSAVIKHTVAMQRPRTLHVAHRYLHVIGHAQPASYNTAGTDTSRVAAPPDSYLDYQVTSVKGLVAEVRNDPAVRARFARHFHVSGNYVADYMQQNLVVASVPRSGRYTVYCVGPSGRIYPTVQHLNGGVKVFAMRNGEPVMKYKCGNPMMSYLPVVQTITVSKPPMVGPSIETIVPTETVVEQVPVESPAPVFAPVVPAAVVYPTVAPPTDKTAGFVETIASHHALSLLPLLLPIPFIHDHNSTTTLTTPPAPVPEMNSGIGFGIGAIIMMMGMFGSSIVRSRKRNEA